MLFAEARHTMWNHWAVRANHPYQPFTHFKLNHWIWNHLQYQFPHALGAVLMPNHLHLLLPSQTEITDRDKLLGMMGAVSLKTRASKLWQPMEHPKIIADRHHLKRTVRYVALNPCRKNLCNDPLEWIWSTYRDLMGASVTPWIIDTKLVQEFKESPRGFKVRFHGYVSGDPSVSVGGTPNPRSALSKILPEEPIRDILFASAAALRLPSHEISQAGPLRTLFIHLAYRQGWTQTSLLTKITAMSRQGLRKNIRGTPPLGLEAAALCLGDLRLRKFTEAAAVAAVSKRETGRLTSPRR